MAINGRTCNRLPNSPMRDSTTICLQDVFDNLMFKPVNRFQMSEICSVSTLYDVGGDVSAVYVPNGTGRIIEATYKCQRRSRKQAQYTHGERSVRCKINRPTGGGGGEAWRLGPVTIRAQFRGHARGERNAAATPAQHFSSRSINY